MMCPTPCIKALWESMTGQSALEKGSRQNSWQSNAHMEHSLAAANKETWSMLLLCQGWMQPEVLIHKGNAFQNTSTVCIRYQKMKGWLINGKWNARIAGPDTWCSKTKDDMKWLPKHWLHERAAPMLCLQDSGSLQWALCHYCWDTKGLHFTNMWMLVWKAMNGTQH